MATTEHGGMSKEFGGGGDRGMGTPTYTNPPYVNVTNRQKVVK